MKVTILTLAVAGALMLAGCGGGGSQTASMGGRTPTPTPTPTPDPEPTPTPAPTPDPTPTPGPVGGGGGTAGTTWEQLPSLLDRPMVYSVTGLSPDFADDQCSSLSSCSAIFSAKKILNVATRNNTERRFEGTTRRGGADPDELFGGDLPYVVRAWGGWLENTIFIAYVYDHASDLINAPEDYGQAIGVHDPNPVQGTYRGAAVDTRGNWGTSEFTYQGQSAGLTINIPARNYERHFDGHAGAGAPVIVDGEAAGYGGYGWSFNFYQGNEVGGQFRDGLNSRDPDTVVGAFGAKLVQ